MKKQSLIKGSLVLGLAGMLAKVLGFFFRWPLIMLIGDEGIGYYQLSYPLYMFFVAMASGVPVAVSKMISERNAVNDIDGIICEKIKHDKNTKITQMLTMWKDGSIDISSYAFRKTLVKMDEDNNNTDILLQGKNNYLIKKLADTII